MKFLCLHGRGTNSDIFESQLGALRSRLSPQHTFDFVDGEYACSAAPGIASLYPGPYLTWFSRYEPERVNKVHDFLRSVMDEDGPYDGIIGFSQGASLAASFLLCEESRRAKSNPGGKSSCSFKVAIFFNAVMLFSPSEDIGSDITEQIKQQEETYTGFLNGEPELQLPAESPWLSPETSFPPSPLSTDTSSSISWSTPKWDDSSTPLSSLSSSSSAIPSRCPSPDGASQQLYVARKSSVAMESLRLLKTPKVFGFPPDTFPCRISIPTLHVIGKDDQFAEHSHALVELCQADKAEVMLVDGGHDLPRSKRGLDECASLFDMVTLMGSLMGS